MPTVLEIDVSRGATPGTVRLQVVESPAGDASATVELDTAAILDRLGDLQQTLLASSVPSRRVVDPQEARVQAVGTRLFDALFSPQALAGVYRASSAVADERGDALRLVLRMSEPELAALPWEAMFDGEVGGYVCRREPLVRYLPVAAPPPPLRVPLPLRVLGVVASPRGLDRLDTEKEKDDLARALAGPIRQGAVELHWAEPATWATVQELLLSGTWHVVHFIGHGDYDVDRDEGVLALESEDGRVHRVAADTFVDLLREARPMPRLVVLNACQTSASGGTDLFSGTAAALVRGGVSAVTAMQFAISDGAAIAFCRGFYAAIAHGRGVDAAVRSGRVAILGRADRTLEWITPTLFLRGRETALFDLTTAPAPPSEERHAVPAGWPPAQPDEDRHAVPPGWPLVPPAPPEARASASAAPDARAPSPRARASAREPSTHAPAGAAAVIGTAGPAPATARPAAPTGPPAPGPGADAAPGADTGASAAPAGEVTEATPTPAPTVETMWQVAKRLRWGDRPWKDELTPLGGALEPGEELYGVCRLVLDSYDSAVVVMTDRYLHVATNKSTSRGWRAFLEQVPLDFRPGTDRVRVPVDALGPAERAGRRNEMRLGDAVVRTPANDLSLALVREYLQRVRPPGSSS